MLERRGLSINMRKVAFDVTAFVILDIAAEQEPSADAAAATESPIDRFDHDSSVAADETVFQECSPSEPILHCLKAWFQTGSREYHPIPLLPQEITSCDWGCLAAHSL